MSISLQVCRSCGNRHYPDASLCFRCGADEFYRTAVAGGDIVSSTDIVYQVGGEGGEPVWLALVQVEDGPALLAQLSKPVPSRCGVTLHMSGKKLVAEPLDL